MFMEKSVLCKKYAMVLYGKHDQLPYKKQKAIRSTKKDGVYDLMTDLGYFYEK